MPPKSISTLASALVIVPNPEELSALVQGFETLGYPVAPLRIGQLDCHFLSPLGVLVAPGGHGKTQLGIQTQYAIDHSTGIQRVLCVGAAGRLDQSLSLGDIVVGTCTIEHDYKARFNPRPSPRHNATSGLIARFNQVARERLFEFRVHLGAIASGDEDIVDRGRASSLCQETEALCVAWEGAGAARAAEFNGLSFAEVRVISDGADPDTPVDYYKNLQDVMPHISQLLAAALC